MKILFLILRISLGVLKVNKFFLVLLLFLLLPFLNAGVLLDEEMCGDHPCNMEGYFSEAPDNLEIVASNVDFDNNEKEFSFEKNSSNGMVGIKGEDGKTRIYENVQDGSIQMDESGKIKTAKLKAGKGGATYFFEADKIPVPEGATVTYDASKKTIDMNISSDSRFDDYFIPEYDKRLGEDPNRVAVHLDKDFEGDFPIQPGQLEKGEIIYEAGVLKVPEGSSAMINGIFISAKDMDVSITDRPGLLEGVFGNAEDEGNYVRIDSALDPEIVINCENCDKENNFGVSFHPTGFRDLDSLDQVDGGYLALPEGGSYRNGDRGAEGTSDYENIVALQRSMGIPEEDQDGIYGPQTEAAVRDFQKQHNLENPNNKIAVDGIFGKDTRGAYLSKSGGITITPENAKIVVTEGVSGFEISSSGESNFQLGVDTFRTEGGEILKKIGGGIRNIASPSDAFADGSTKNLLVPVNINVKDNQGDDKQISFSNGYHKKVQGTKSVYLGGKEYLLENGEAYILTAGQTAFTKAVAPPISSEELQNLPKDFREKVAGVGHMGIMYVDPDTGQVRVTESDWSGVRDVPFSNSHMYNVKDQVGGVYYFSNADSHKIIQGSKDDAQKNIGWFFTDVDSFVGTATVNKLTGNDYSEYRSCSGHVCMLASYGGADLLDDVAYVPLQNAGKEALEKYINSYGIKGTIADKSYAEIGAGLLQKSIYAIDKIDSVKSMVGLDPSATFATPSQIILGNVEGGVIVPLEPQTTGSFLRDMTTKLERIGYEGSSPIEIQQFQKDYNQLNIGPKISESGNFDYNTVKALERYCSRSDKCD